MQLFNFRFYHLVQQSIVFLPQTYAFDTLCLVVSSFEPNEIAPVLALPSDFMGAVSAISLLPGGHYFVRVEGSRVITVHV